MSHGGDNHLTAAVLDLTSPGPGVQPDGAAAAANPAAAAGDAAIAGEKRRRKGPCCSLCEKASCKKGKRCPDYTSFHKPSPPDPDELLADVDDILTIIDIEFSQESGSCPTINELGCCEATRKSGEWFFPGSSAAELHMIASSKYERLSNTTKNYAPASRGPP